MEYALPKDKNIPIDLLGTGNEWSVLVRHYAGGATYSLMKHGDCFGDFPGIKEIREFADMLENDLQGARVMPTALRKTYEDVIRALRSVGKT